MPYQMEEMYRGPTSLTSSFTLQAVYGRGVDVQGAELIDVLLYITGSVRWRSRCNRGNLIDELLYVTGSVRWRSRCTRDRPH